MDGRKKIRLQYYGYSSDGYYFVTIVSKLRRNIFEKNENKTKVEGELKDVVQKNPGASLDYFVVMPNHIHVILILRNCQLYLGEIVRRFKAKVTHLFMQNVWQANYYEHVIRDEAGLEKIRLYIINNPQELLSKFDQFYK